MTGNRTLYDELGACCYERQGIHGAGARHGGQLYRIAQAMLWRDADCADAIQEAVFRGWMKIA